MNGPKGPRPSAGLQDGLVGLAQDLVADLGVGDGPVLLAQVETQLTLVAEVQVTLLTLKSKRGPRRKSVCTCSVFKYTLCMCVCVCSLTHGVRLLAGVNAQVALQGLQVAEAGATGVAGVRLLPGVDQNVGSQMGDLTPDQRVENICVCECNENNRRNNLSGVTEGLRVSR